MSKEEKNDDIREKSIIRKIDWWRCGKWPATKDQIPWKFLQMWKKKKKKNQQRLKIKTLMTEIAVPKYSNE